MLLSGRGPEQQAKGADTVMAFTNLMLALGKVGRPSSGYGCLTGQGNGQGGRVARQWQSGQITGLIALSAADVWVFGTTTTGARAIGTWHFDGSAWRQVGGDAGVGPGQLHRRAERLEHPHRRF